MPPVEVLPAPRSILTPEQIAFNRLRLDGVAAYDAGDRIGWAMDTTTDAMRPSSPCQVAYIDALARAAPDGETMRVWMAEHAVAAMTQLSHEMRTADDSHSRIAAAAIVIRESQRWEALHPSRAAPGQRSRRGLSREQSDTLRQMIGGTEHIKAVGE